MSAAQRFRPDIEGLRAIAITSVVLYHAGIGHISGGFVGVDLFFVLSGFLISGMLIREIETTGRVHLANFWARRVRRLLPAATLVLMLTVLVSSIVLPPTIRTDTANAVVAATLYSANWFFASNSLDYLAAEDAPSPVLHFWSLGVEEQFYLVWPILLLALGLLARRFGWSLRRIFAVAAGAIWLGSFAACIYYSTESQPVAFFSAPTRFWQLATGAVLAIATPWLSRATKRAHVGLQVGGLVVLLWSIVMMGALVDGGRVYPGWIALIPTLATAAIVAGGMRDKLSGPSPIDKVLTWAPFQWLGGLSYSWYLWHWPVLVLWQAKYGTASHTTALALVGAALLCAWAANRLIENPIRFWKPLQTRAGSSLLIGGLLMSVTVVSAAGLSLTDASHADLSNITFHPLPSQARNDLSAVYADNCVVEYHDVGVHKCTFGDPTAKATMALIGDSHAASYFPAVDQAAKNLGFRLDVYIKLGCSTADVVQWHYKFEKPFVECTQWRKSLIADLAAAPVDVVVMVNADNPTPQVFDPARGQKLAGQPGQQAWIAGYARTLRTLQATGATVIALRDNPRVPGIIADCISMHMDHPDKCDFPRTVGLLEPAADMAAAAMVDGVRTIDLTSRICDLTTCFAIRDNILAWQKGNHYTATFARSLADEMTARIATILGRVA